MNIEDIVKAEADNTGTIILFREGVFWKAYERSAYAFCKHIKSFVVRKKYIKSINDEIVSVGFPMSSSKTLLQGKVILLEEEKKMIVSIGRIDLEGFMAWKKEQILSVPAVSPSCGNNSPRVSDCSDLEKEVISQIKQFSVENKTPFECMLFLSEIKKQLLS
ncbi:MAG: hypothetical protein LBU44_03030 [Mediterranea sp.]|jgi:hypothetical protein|nr:hypothetical protein [Mediterranea sp.]